MPPSPSPPPPSPSSPPPSPSPPPPPPKPKFEEKSSTTPFAPDGGSVEYGNVHRVACANNSALVGFEFQSTVEGEETKVRNAYACVEALFDQGATFGHATLANETEHGPSGSKSLERNALDTLSEHEVDCADRFVTSWNLKQWSKSISIEYACASGKPTPKPDACVTSESAKVELDASKVSSLAPAKVSCTKGSALTRFRFTGDAFEFTCCPTPALE
ncbi:hypothetical protein BE221DRAFT_113256 [Ostreococcus tauri]|uniref:Uncharacterized protein n=1 Tax=Ostreococcus tauri TaxID=70448 RepID=A0A1Y5IEW8_OSTTA|nr:hypothetical protein BE221DRAFT_113256 [Ostreococcus tauri]